MQKTTITKVVFTEDELRKLLANATGFDAETAVMHILTIGGDRFHAPKTTVTIEGEPVKPFKA